MQKGGRGKDEVLSISVFYLYVNSSEKELFSKNIINF